MPRALTSVRALQFACQISILGYFEGEDDDEADEEDLRTPEERAAWEASRHARLRELNAHIERITAELEAKRRGASSETS